jgi:Fic family protein
MSDDENKLFGSLRNNDHSLQPADIYTLRDQMVRHRLRELGYDTAESVYIHQKPDWPAFYWNNETLAKHVASVYFKHGLLVGHMESIKLSLHSEVVLEILATEALKSSEIEGENLNKRQIRSAAARHLGMEAEGMPVTPNIEGIVEMAYDAMCKCREPLTKERLLVWHAGLFPPGAGGLKKIRAGVWRNDKNGPMQIVSGPIGRERVHYEAPAAERLEVEMSAFLNWVNSEDSTDPVLRAGIAHFWFVTIHPFNDGNGRIARAITNMMLARSEDSSPLCYSLSAQIYRDRDAYYRMLESTQKGTLDITDYLGWFLDCVDLAIDSADTRLANLVRKTCILETSAAEFNDRQRRVLGKLLNDFKGKLTVSKWAKLAKCSQDTAVRDIDDLITRGVLVKNPASFRVVSYLLAEKGSHDKSF